MTVTRHPHLDPAAAFFTTGECDKLVYCATPAAAGARERLGAVATVVDAGASPSMCWVRRAPGRPRASAGSSSRAGRACTPSSSVPGLADELHVVVAPFFVGDPLAPRVVADGRPPWNRDRPARLAEVRQLDDVVLLRYALSPRFEVEEHARSGPVESRR